MTIFRRFVIGCASFVVVLALVLAIAWIRTGPGSLPPESSSASRLSPGPYSIGKKEFHRVDPARSTAANGDFEGSPERSFDVVLWFPEAAPGDHPLLVYSHGFVSSRYGGAYLAKHMASHGYVVVSADFPLTHIGAPGGPFADDVVNQPGDVSFLIDQVLALEAEERPFEGGIDGQRIGAFGISLGAATTTLVAFHEEWRDSRIGAAISIAGPGDVFGPLFFDRASAPFLMIAGTSDSIVDYELNALPIPGRIQDGGLLSIEGGTHIGFTDFASGVVRLLGSPDAIGCRLGGADPDPSMDHPFSGLFGSAEQGLIEVSEYLVPCTRVFDHSMRAARQHMLTKLAVHAFFESVFAHEPEVRSQSEEFLAHTLPEEVPELSYAAAQRVRSQSG